MMQHEINMDYSGSQLETHEEERGLKWSERVYEQRNEQKIGRPLDDWLVLVCR